MSKGTWFAIAVTITATASTGPADAYYAFCMQPSAPNLFVTRPSKPYCYNGCEDWQIRAYRDDVDRYFRRLKDYLIEVDDYYEEAYAYAKCMADLD